MDLNQIHKECNNNKEKLSKSTICGCFYCLKIYKTNEISEWVDKSNDTDLCPYCGIDAVLPEASYYYITDELLAKMKNFYF